MINIIIILCFTLVLGMEFKKKIQKKQRNEEEKDRLNWVTAKKNNVCSHCPSSD